MPVVSTQDTAQNAIQEARQTTVPAEPSSVAATSASETTLSEASAAIQDALITAPASAHAQAFGSSMQSIAEPCQAQDSCAAARPSASSAQQETLGRELQQEDAVPRDSALNGSIQQPLRPSAPFSSSAAAWAPILMNWPVHSITDVACMQLVPEFLDDICQVLSLHYAAVLLVHSRMAFFGARALQIALSMPAWLL